MHAHYIKYKVMIGYKYISSPIPPPDLPTLMVWHAYFQAFSM